MTLSIRLAKEADLPALHDLMNASIAGLLPAFLTPEQVEGSYEVMGVDTQLVKDETYFVVEEDGHIIGCGGWSRRATLFGGDHTDGRDPELLDLATEPARVRAMYTHPDHTRKGVGRMVLEACEAAASAEGFVTVELAATMAGLPFYKAYGFTEIEHFDAATSNGAKVPLVRMQKACTR